VVSHILLTLDRYELTKEIVNDTLSKAGYPFELLVCDNGSADHRVCPMIEGLYPSVFIKNKYNQGVAKMQNQLIRQAKGEYICLIGNDIRMPENWLNSVVEIYKQIPQSGIAGIHCVERLHPEVNINGLKVHEGGVFGTMLFSKSIYDEVGKICEDYHPYGLEDSDLNIRVLLAGYRNYYINGLSSSHEGADMHTDSDYRAMKNKSIEDNATKFEENVRRYKETNNYPA